MIQHQRRKKRLAMRDWTIKLIYVIRSRIIDIVLYEYKLEDITEWKQSFIIP